MYCVNFPNNNNNFAINLKLCNYVQLHTTYRKSKFLRAERSFNEDYLLILFLLYLIGVTFQRV